MHELNHDLQGAARRWLVMAALAMVAWAAAAVHVSLHNYVYYCYLSAAWWDCSILGYLKWLYQHSPDDD